MTSRAEVRRRWSRSFADRLDAPLPKLTDVIRVARSGGFDTDLTDASLIPVHRQGLPRLGAGQTGVTWVGHATFVLQIGGLIVLTDPVWSRRIPGVRPRLTPPGVGWGELPRVDAVVISHNHYDHLDAATVRRLPRDTALFVPARLGGWFRRRGFRRVTDLDWWESATFRDVQFTAVPAHHWSRRGVGDTCRTLWGGWVIDGDHRVYFAGDTGYGRYFHEIGARHPEIDVALMPVGAYEPRWFLRSVHMDPDEAVRAHRDLGASQMAAMHWGTFVMSAEPLLDPIERTRARWREAGLPADALWDLAIGESRVLG